MRIGVIGWEMEDRATGVGRVLEGFLGGLTTTAPPEWTFDVHFRSAPPETAGATPGRPVLPNDPRFRARWDDRPGSAPVRWEQLRLPRILAAERPDLLYSPGYSLPLASSVPGVLTVHDLSFEHRGRELRFQERWRRRLLARWSCRRARRILADTTRGAEELRKLYGIPTARVGVVPLGVAARFRPAAGDAEAAFDAECLRELGLEGPYLLCLGSIFPRRHVPDLVEAFARLAPSYADLRLVLVGANFLPEPAVLDRALVAAGLGERIRHVGWADDALVPALYRGATLSVYLSDYEGYGLPPLESLAAGTPALVGPGLALDELWPDYPLRLVREDLGRPAAIAAALDRALDDAEGLRRLGAEGAAFGRSQTWEAAARRLCGELREAAA